MNDEGSKNNFLVTCERQLARAENVVNNHKKFLVELEGLNLLIEEHWTEVFNESSLSSMSKEEKNDLKQLTRRIKFLEQIAKSKATWFNGLEDFTQRSPKT